MTTEHQTVYAEMAELNRSITYHADLYFNKEIEEIPNHVYDEMVQRWEELADANPEIAALFETANKPVPIHEPTSQSLDQFKFDEAMLSLRKALNIDAVESFLEGLPEDTEVDYELKLDGLALEAHYVDGVLTSLFTRGDGLVGENVTHSLPLFGESIPKTIFENDPAAVKGLVKVRGEGFILVADFNNYNDVAPRPAASPRNGVSGWVRASVENQNELLIGVLKFACYWSSHTFGCETYKELRDKLCNQGLFPPPFASWEAIQNNTPSTTFPFDGIVIKVNDFELQKKLGVTNRYPRWAIAYKYPNVTEVTSLENIEWNTTRTGRVVPVGIYAPVKIGGVTCTRALLDNYKQFLTLELRHGSLIMVSRNNDVIPRLRQVVDHLDGELFKAPEDCPSCGYMLEVRTTKQSADLVCTNVTECPEQLLLRCVTFANKRTLDIDGLGPVTVASYVDQGYIKRPSDILNLPERLVGEKIFARIKEVKEGQPLYRIIKALGLPAVDLGRAKKLSRAYPEQINLFTWLSDPGSIQKVPGFSAGLAIPISLAFEDEEFMANAIQIVTKIRLLEELELETEIRICITGSLGLGREELKDYFGKFNLELVDKITKDCKYLIVGELPGQGKLLKATEFNIPMIDTSTTTSIDALIQLIKSGASS